MEAKLEHLRLISAVITRMAYFALAQKVLAVVLVLGVLIGTNANIIFAYLLVLLFWLTDGYYLWQERLYRAWYDQVRTLPEAAIDFSLKVDPTKLDNGTGYARCLFSKSVLWFYLVLDLTIFGGDQLKGAQLKGKVLILRLRQGRQSTKLRD